VILVDKKCEVCGKVFIDKFSDEETICCGKPAKRIFGYRKYSEFVPGFYSHFTHEDIYIDSPDTYSKMCKKYNVEQMGGKGVYDRGKGY
jgi:thymidine kinase